MKKLLLAGALLLGSLAASAEAGSFEIVPKVGETNVWPSMTSYTPTKPYETTVEIGGTKWKSYGLGNNNNSWTYWRTGTKSTTDGNSYISSSNPVQHNVTKVTMNVTKYIRSGVNSFTLVVADNAEYNNATTYTCTSEIKTAGEYSIDAPDDTFGKYLKVNINYTNSITTNGVIEFDKVTFDYEDGEAPSVDAPTFEMVEGAEGFSVAISAAEGAEIRYTTDGTEPTETSTLYTAPIEVWEPTVVKAIAILNGEKSYVGSFNANPPYILDGFMALTDFDGDAKIVVKGKMTAVYQNGKYLYVRDSNGAYMLVFGLIDQTFNNGDTFNRLDGDFSVYVGQPEITNPVFGEITTGGEAVEPAPASIALLPTMLCHYVTLEGLTIDEAKTTATDADGNTITLYNRFNTEYNAGAGMTVTGFVAKYNNTIQLYPVAVEHNDQFLAAPVFNPADGSDVELYKYVTLTAEEGATIMFKYGEMTEFEEYADDSIVFLKTGTYTVEAYATREGVTSETVTATFNAVLASPGLRWTDTNFETITEMTYVIDGDEADKQFPMIDGIMEGEVSITSSNPEVAYLNDAWEFVVAGKGTTIFTVSVTAAGAYRAEEAELRFTVIGADEKPIVSRIVFNGKEGFAAATTAQTWTCEAGYDWYVTHENGHNGATGTTYATVSENDLRLYGSAGNKLTFTVPAGYMITSVLFSVDTANSTGIPGVNGNATSKLEDNSPALRAAAKYEDHVYTFADPVYKFFVHSTETSKHVRIQHMEMTMLKDPTGVCAPEVDNSNDAEAVYYNLQGVRVANPAQGLYIRVQGNKATKTLVR